MDNMEMAVLQANASKDIVKGMDDVEDVMYCSFKVESNEEKIKLYNATSGDAARLADSAGEVISMMDVVVIPVDILNKDGSTATCPRATIITTEGEYLACTSWGVYNSLRRLNSIFGSLHFENGLKVQAVEVKTKSGSTINLKVIG